MRWIFYTSGTTAEPKGAQHTDRSVLAGAIGYAKKTHVVDDDIALVAFPFTHVGGIIIGVFTPLLTGSAAVLMEAWTAAGVDRADRASTASRSRNGAAAIHAALIAEAKAEPRRVHDDPRLPERRLGEAAAAARRAEGGGAVERSARPSGYGMTEAPIVSQTDIDAPEDVEARSPRARPTTA